MFSLIFFQLFTSMASPQLAKKATIKMLKRMVASRAAKKHKEAIRRRKFSIRTGAEPNPLTEHLHHSVHKNLIVCLYYQICIDESFQRVIIQSVKGELKTIGVAIDLDGIQNNVLPVISSFHIFVNCEAKKKSCHGQYLQPTFDPLDLSYLIHCTSCEPKK